MSLAKGATLLILGREPDLSFPNSVPAPVSTEHSDREALGGGGTQHVTETDDADAASTACPGAVPDMSVRTTGREHLLHA